MILVVDEAEGMYAVAEDCVSLVRETGIDCLAPALGSVHGPYRGQPKLGFDRMAEIRTLTGLPLVLHGGSGLPDEEIRQAIACGTAKINVNTDNQIAFTAAIRSFLNEHPEAYDPRNYLVPAREAIIASVRAKIQLFGSTRQSGRERRMNKIRIGIIGAGRIGKIHADNLLRIPQVEIIAVSDLFAGPELEAWAASRQIQTVTKDSHELIDNPDIDAIFICSSTDTHVPLIQLAAQAGKHIFCEKPISMDITQTEAAIACG